MSFRILGRRTDNKHIDICDISSEEDAIREFSIQIGNALDAGVGLQIQLRKYTDVKVWHQFRKAELSEEILQ